MTRKIISILFLLTASAAAVAQQNLQFSQYAFNGLSVNPAYAGYKEMWFLNATYRQQWTSLPGAPKTGSISIDGVAPAPDNRVGLGLQFMYDKLGPQQALALYANYAYRIPLDETGNRRICLGIGAGATQYSVDGTALTYNDDNDQAIPPGVARKIVPDFRFGVYFFTPRFYAGLSAMDLLSEINDGTRYSWKGNDYATIKKIRHYYLTLGTMFPLSEHVSFKPSLLVKEDFKGPTNLDLNAVFLVVEKIWLGASWRTGVKVWNKDHLQDNLSQKDAFSFQVQFFATDYLRIGYAYDYTTNGLASYEKGTHEIGIGYGLFSRKNKARTLSPRYF
ncbi:PorP/SprF family type IX secretion system membrane protein [Chitinophaga japonensis]|uniref:Type IX secretion system PorP/SprF family membrane protein n=1 Tax=Chitinophaga japonensis TaxID=104662 RepID=A0A562SMF4_CHIJA|nr:type IX secretion system membrane protein PorP/SprF [Chitinophaga japonensis]TWI82491.1 type IX secretion system PorP/SprF family membrane protein [Chitinophaga japonensis]